MPDLRRRQFLTLLGGAAAAWPLAARAQQSERVRRVGVLMAHPESDPEFKAYLGAFREGLQKLGWTEGRNIAAEMARRSARLERQSRRQTRAAAFTVERFKLLAPVAEASWLVAPDS